MNGVEMVVGKYMNDLRISAVCSLFHDDKVGEMWLTQPAPPQDRRFAT